MSSIDMRLELITFFVFLSMCKVRCLLVKPQEFCVPTQVVKGPCHECICSSNGVFFCHATPCRTTKINPRKSRKGECQRHVTYKFEDLYCSCNYEGKWISFDCRETFQYLRSENIAKRNLISNITITCTPNSLFLIYCNICQCEKSGVIQPSSCTNRDCTTEGHKSDICRFGDFLRTNEEICVCSDINFYIDRLCVRVGDTNVQELQRNDIALITNISQIWKRMERNTSVKEVRIKIKTTNFQNDHDRLPEIRDGQSCVSGKVYKMSCNTCQCGESNELLCTKMACFENALRTEIKQIKKDEHKEEKKMKSKIRRVKKIKKDSLRKGLHSNEKKKLVNRKYPQLPEGKCEPGMTYTNGCKKCFCNEKKVAKCTRTCSNGFPNKFSDEEISEMETRSVLDLPELPHTGAKCDPGRTYYVVCNICFCSHKQDLFCSAKYCVNVSSFADVHSKELTGRPCKSDFRLLCSDCKCVNHRSQCKPTSDCGRHLTGKQLLSSAADANVELSLDIKKEKCKPHVSYKLHCNECYCQADGSLRCTQKVCLTYSQSKDLQEKQTYLERHGF